MKKSIFLVFIFLISINLPGQNDLGKSDDTQRIAVMPYFSKSKINSKDGSLLLSKMGKLLSKDGLSSYYSRYVMWPRIDATEDVTGGTSVRHVMNLDVSFYIADNITKTVYASTSYTVTGVDRKKDKARARALKKINLTNEQGQQFLNDAKNRIIEFYNSKCDFILKEAQSKASRKQYDNAIFDLTSIPEICKECFMKGQDLAVKVFKDKMENQCMELIAQAKTAKAKNNYDLAASYLSSILPDVSCYKEAQSILKEVEDHRCAVALGEARCAWAAGNYMSAGKWLGQVASDSKCASDAQKLGNEIKSKLKADEDRAWTYKLRVHSDLVELEKNRINAIKAIGVAFGENQQPPADINWIDNRR